MKTDKPRTFWLQQGSFRTVVVDDDKANPEWGRKPFEVIEIFAVEQLKAEILLLKDVIESISVERKNDNSVTVRYKNPIFIDQQNYSLNQGETFRIRMDTSLTKEYVENINKIKAKLQDLEQKLAAQERVIAKLKEQRNHYINLYYMGMIPSRRDLIEPKIKAENADLEQLTKESK